MRKKDFCLEIRSFIITFLLFFILCGFVVTVSFLIFFRSTELPPEEVREAAPITFINILIITIVFVLIDTIRRKITVDRPVKQIKKALKQITKGNFDVRLNTQGINSNFAEIMESINIMTTELSGVETLRTDFIANVSHEMKTPLAVIGNYGTLLQSDSLSDEQRAEYARIITNSTKRLAELMTNILKLNRLENQQIYPQSKEYDLSEQLCQCFLQFETIWEDKKIEIDTDIPENITVNADAELLSLVWNNLFSNAFKFTEKGGTVTVSLSTDEKYTTVKVTDTGCGMTKEVGSHIFEKFYQGDTSHAMQGNGLGLALVKRIMDITGGEISVNSSVGIGSTFAVKLRRNTNGTL
ncbi:histidine kinase [Clostridium bornimense]|uniref:histidine kinase n=1 Tax=Clostridium bornimense TaxID=1216932 RepID=W6RTE7_9CLOT|nr:HAMP domain-containing sensor histidine kinase [Clostridium bornimense]CDM67548.1 histidine kinase [Clostridium bornimense]